MELRFEDSKDAIQHTRKLSIRTSTIWTSATRLLAMRSSPIGISKQSTRRRDGIYRFDSKKVTWSCISSEAAERNLQKSYCHPGKDPTRSRVSTSVATAPSICPKTYDDTQSLQQTCSNSTTITQTINETQSWTKRTKSSISLSGLSTIADTRESVSTSFNGEVMMKTKTPGNRLTLSNKMHQEQSK